MCWTISNYSKKLNKPEIWDNFEQMGGLRKRDRTYDIIFCLQLFLQNAASAGVPEKMNRMAGSCASSAWVRGGGEIVTGKWKRPCRCVLAYDKKDYIYFINILYQMGIDANIQIIPLSKDITFPDLGAGGAIWNLLPL